MKLVLGHIFKASDYLGKYLRKTFENNRESIFDEMLKK